VSVDFDGIIHSFSECSHITGCFFYCVAEHDSFITQTVCVCRMPCDSHGARSGDNITQRLQ
jgi:hypothetical protein